MSGRVTTVDIEIAKSKHEELVERFLRQHGFERTCKTPGALWLWEKVVDGRQLLASRDLAFAVAVSEDNELAARTAHEFGEDADCIYCRLSWDSFERGAFTIPCLPEREVRP